MKYLSIAIVLLLCFAGCVTMGAVSMALFGWFGALVSLGVSTLMAGTVFEIVYAYWSAQK